MALNVADPLPECANGGESGSWPVWDWAIVWVKSPLEL